MTCPLVLHLNIYASQSLHPTTGHSRNSQTAQPVAGPSTLTLDALVSVEQTTVVDTPPRKKQKADDVDEDGEVEGAKDPNVMNFTLFTKRGNKQQTRQIAIPAESALAVQTRTAQMQDKVEQQHLKRLVLNYEQREEAEELKGMWRPFLPDCECVY